MQKINNTLSTIFVFWLIHQTLVPLSNFFHKLETILTKALVSWIVRSLKYLIIFLGIVAVLEVWGIKIGPVIAGLGLFGVAVALGAQDLFKNLISGIMILLEKRFHIGGARCRCSCHPLCVRLVCVRVVARQPLLYHCPNLHHHPLL